jgi:ABC-2 type transport system permease protein
VSAVALERRPAVQARVVVALAQRALAVQLRRAQFLIPAFVLPLVLLAVIASGTSAGRNLPGFPTSGSYIGFVIGGALLQGALLAGMTAGTAMAGDIEGGFFDRLLAAPVHRASIVLGRVVASLVLGAAQACLFLAVGLIFGADYAGGVLGVAAAVVLTAMVAGAAAGATGALALRTGSVELLRNFFPMVFVLLFTAPAFFPRELLSPAMHAVTRFNPLTYVVEGIRAVLHDDRALGSPAAGFACAAGLLALSTALAVLAMRARTRGA